MNTRALSQSSGIFAANMRKEAPTCQQQGTFRSTFGENGWGVRSDEVSIFVEGAVERGGVVDQYALADEIGCSLSIVRDHLHAHPLVQVKNGRGKRLTFWSIAPPPQPTQEGLLAFEEEKAHFDDRLGRDARADFYGLVRERTQMARQKKIGRRRVIRRF